MKKSIPGASQFAGRKIAILGMGISGVAALEVLQAETDAILSIWDQSAAALAPYEDKVVAKADSDAERLVTELIAWQPEIVVIAPAFSEVGVVWQRLQEAEIPIWSEIELAWQLRAQNPDGTYPQWLCVTGTNGKTTTVTMLAAILQEAGYGGEAIGNIGVPAVRAVANLENAPVRAFALELSSFQLAATYSMMPVGAICLNIADDHLSWHGTRRAYAQAKARIYRGVQEAAIYPAKNSAVEKMVQEAALPPEISAISYTLSAPAVGEIGLVPDPAAGEILAVDRAFVSDPVQAAEALFSLADLAHLGDGEHCPPHIVLDALAAAALARSIGISAEYISAAFRHYQVELHRLQFIGEWNGIRWIDDSKATNGHAAQAALRAQGGRKIIWIVGGDAKGADFTELVEEEKSILAGVVVIGKDQRPWKKALAVLEVPVVYVDAVENPLPQAVKEAHNLARVGETVLLAPACASLDQFSSYVERGKQFQQEVRKLLGG